MCNKSETPASRFIDESQVYQLLEKVSIKTPKYCVVSDADEIDLSSFPLAQSVVVKGLADDLWHKSDNHALAFCQFEPEIVARKINSMQQLVGQSFNWRGALICEKVVIDQGSQAPSEIFIGIQTDPYCGAVVSLGFGGLLTEVWAEQLKQSLLIWPISVYSAQEAFIELEGHWLGQILLGHLRQQPALVSASSLQQLLKQLWRLAALMIEESIALLEINPMVVNEKSELVALDGVGLKSTQFHAVGCPIPMQDESFLNPKRIALAGVSKKAGSVGRLIMDNIRQSSLPEDAIVLIKPGCDRFQGIRCIADISALQSEPADILILALPAKLSVSFIEHLCQQGSGAQTVYIVAGGIGDGADENGYGERLKALLRQRRRQNQWCPAIVGPNGLGMILSPLKLNSLFIPQAKLNVNFSPESPVALISQSGAFLITRLSRHSSLSLKYGFSIGNQLDMKLSDFMALMLRDKSIKVLGLYIEGFADGDVCAVANLVESFRQQNRHVIIYKGGRSRLGQVAAAGHTGAMTGNYQIQKRLLQKAGSVMVESFNQFNAVFKWMAAYPDLRQLGQLAIVTNAGYETVGSVDSLGDNDPHRLYELNETNKQSLVKVLAEHGLQGIAAPVNPLDLTPMADELAFFDCVESMLNFGAGVVIIGLVPLAEKLDTVQFTENQKFARRLKQLANSRGKLIGVVIDAGVPYQDYKSVFEAQGFPVFDGMDMAVLGINVLARSR